MKKKPKFKRTGQLLKDLFIKLVFNNWNWHFNEKEPTSPISFICSSSMVEMMKVTVETNTIVNEKNAQNLVVIASCMNTIKILLEFHLINDYLAA